MGLMKAADRQLYRFASEITDDVEVGGKAEGLARLVGAGAKVPPWCVLTNAAMCLHIDRDLVKDEIDAGLAAIREGGVDDAKTLESLCERMQRAILEAPLPDRVLSVVRRAVGDLGGGPLAVRSSMLGEDSTSHSFAGQLESYLFQTTFEEVVTSVRKCWASAFAPRVFRYRLQAGDALHAPRMGVVIQAMIDGEVSGVGFSAHPVTGNRSHVLITGAWGWGEGVVSGLCNTDEFVWGEREGELEAKIAVKDVAIVAKRDGSGTDEVSIAPERQSVRCLSREDVDRIGSEIARIASEFGTPQDVEWTLRGSEFFVLQSRPITALPVPENLDGPVVVFNNSNIQESYCGVTTPLTFSFAQRAYASVYEQTLRALHVPEAEIQQYRPILQNLLGLVNGRVYYNINNWYRGLQLLPAFQQNKADMERMMGLDVPVDFVEDRSLSFTQKLRLVPKMLGVLWRLRRAFSSMASEVVAWLQRFDSVVRGVNRTHFEEATFSELMDVSRHLKTTLMEHWHTPILNDFYVMMSMGALRRLVEQSGVEAVDAIINNLIAGEDGVESTEPTYMLMRMARVVRSSDELRASLDSGEWRRRSDGVFAEFRVDFDRYIDRYGDRCMGELKLETISLREDAGFVVDVLRNYSERADLEPESLREKEKELRRAAEETLRHALSPLGRMRMQKILTDARSSVKFRENMRLARTRLFGLYRDVYRAIGTRLVEAQRLSDARDVFYLTVDEIEAYHEGRAVSADLASIAHARRREYAAYESQELPHHFVTRGPVYHGNRFENPHQETVDEDAVSLKGTGCYPGVVDSTLKVVMSPNDELSVNGRILTTLRTDPGWAPLFPTAQGILVERGSTLSHSAVVARELGIPAVVGVPNLLATVKDGERVKMDGASGIVHRLDVQTTPSDVKEAATP